MNNDEINAINDISDRDVIVSSGLIASIILISIALYVLAFSIGFLIGNLLAYFYL